MLEFHEHQLCNGVTRFDYQDVLSSHEINPHARRRRLMVRFGTLGTTYLVAPRCSPCTLRESLYIYTSTRAPFTWRLLPLML
jgi:hypothetical protein